MTRRPVWPARGVVVLGGPSAAGKTEVALLLAKDLDAEIISADSRQIYRGLDLGTGKPTPAERRRVRHHLLSACPLGRAVTAADFARLAEAAYRDIARRGRRCLVVGGTGLWIKAFVDGLTPGPPPNPQLRERLQERARREGRGSLHRELERLDPATAGRLHPSDQVRVIRALEILHAGLPPSRLRRRAGTGRRPACLIALFRSREELYARAERRVEAWLSAGWLDQVEALRKAARRWRLPALRAIGFDHLLQVLEGGLGRDRAAELIRRDTRRYIKRQLTWFRADPRWHWVDASGGSEAARAEILSLLGELGWWQAGSGPGGESGKAAMRGSGRAILPAGLRRCERPGR